MTILPMMPAPTVPAGGAAPVPVDGDPVAAGFGALMTEQLGLLADGNASLPGTTQPAEDPVPAPVPDEPVALTAPGSALLTPATPADEADAPATEPAAEDADTPAAVGAPLAPALPAPVPTTAPAARPAAGAITGEPPAAEPVEPSAAAPVGSRATPAPATAATAATEVDATDPQPQPAAVDTRQPPTPVVAPAPVTPSAAPALAAPLEGSLTPTQPSHPVLDQVTPAVSRLASGPEGVHRMMLRLHPADLGEVHLTVTVRGDTVDVTVAAAPEARELLAEGSGQLRGLLDALGRTAGHVVFRDLPGTGSTVQVTQNPAAAPNPDGQQSGQPTASYADPGRSGSGGHGDSGHSDGRQPGPEPTAAGPDHRTTRPTRTPATGPVRGGLDVRM